jgi:hypothetical protein
MSHKKRPTMRAGGLGGTHREKAAVLARSFFSVSTAGPPTKPLTRAVGLNRKGFTT